MGVNLPIQNYFTKTDGPSWERPSDWPVITDVINEVQFLMSDLGDSNCSITTIFTRTSGSQNIIIDWGDGTTNTISTNTTITTQHTYAPGTGTPCSLGYTTFKIRVYFTGTGVTVMNTCQIQALFISGNIFSAQDCNVLEAYYGDGTVPSIVPTFYSVAGNSSSLSTFAILQYVKLPITVLWTSMVNTFNGCTQLVKIVMPVSASGLTNLSTVFGSCVSLLELTLPSNATGISTFASIFGGCNNLRTVTFPTTLNSCISFASTFQNCYNLRNITLPPVNTCRNFNSTFNGCTQLEWVKFTSMPTVALSIDFTTGIANCPNLQNIYFPTTGTTTSTYNFSQAFQNNIQLKTLTFPSNINVTTFTNSIQGCSSLVSCTLPVSTPSCTSFTYIFNNCYSLVKVTLPSTLSSPAALDGAFQNCYKLQEVTIPSANIITSLGSTFNGCYSLKTLNWTPGAQNSLSSLSLAFQSCFILENVNMPTSMTALTNLQSTFSGCRALKSITLPSTLNSVSSVSSLFINCASLTSVSLPTSMNVCTNFSNMFNGCRSITSITLPNTVSTSTTTFSGTFNSCVSLKNLTLPGAAQLSLVTDIGFMFVNCSNLATITNFEKIGSLTTTPKIGAGGLQFNKFLSISFAGPLSILQLNASNSGGRVDIQSVRLLNTSTGQWAGTSPQINVSFTNMSTANLVQLFNDIAAQGTTASKTINITGAIGTAGLTSADRLIITSKGWTITG